MRLQLKGAAWTVAFDDYLVRQGEPVLAIHIWNEHMPKIPPQGADLAWALELRRNLIYTFRCVAKEMQSDTRYAPVRAVCGESALFSFSEHIGGKRMMEHLGFTVLPYHRPAGRFGEFWENLFSWWMMSTYNNASLLSRGFWRLQRTEIWMRADEFIRRYGEALDVTPNGNELRQPGFHE